MLVVLLGKNISTVRGGRGGRNKGEKVLRRSSSSVRCSGAVVCHRFCISASSNPFLRGISLLSVISSGSRQVGILGGKINEWEPWHDPFLDRGERTQWRYTKFEVNRTNIEWVTLPTAPSVSSGDLLPDVRLTSTMTWQLSQWHHPHLRRPHPHPRRRPRLSPLRPHVIPSPPVAHGLSTFIDTPPRSYNLLRHLTVSRGNEKTRTYGRMGQWMLYRKWKYGWK